VAESTLSLSYTDLLVSVGVFLGYKPLHADRSAVQQAEVERYIQAGVRQFYYPPASEGIEAGYQWSFLTPTTTIDTTADQADDDLPDDLGRVLGDFYYEPDNFLRSIVLVSEARMLACRQESTDSGTPRYASVHHKTSTGADGQRFEVSWWPAPDAVYTLSYKYEAYQGVISATYKYPLGGMKHSELILESCLAVAEQRGNDERGLHWDSFISLLKAGIAQDRKIGAGFYGHMGAQEGDVVSRRSNQSSYDITYKGDTW